MTKKRNLLMAAAAVIAFAIPTSASAATGLTMPAATLVPVGTIITGANSGVVRITSSKTGTLKCASVMFEAKVLVNNSSLVEAGIGGTSSATTCSNAAGTFVTFKNFAITNLRSTGGGTGTLTASTEVTLPGGTTCKYKGSGTMTYKPSETEAGGGIITITEMPLSVEPAACGTTASLDGVFLLSTQGTGGSGVFNIFLM